MAYRTSTLFFGCAAIFLLFFSSPVAAFGAGNIINVSKIAGKNWRHGDIEDVLLELFMSKAGNAKFDSLAVKRVYFGNWLRDYSQALDVGGLSKLPKDTIRILLWVLSFLTFGFATGEFEVTEEKLGVYRPEEHIDNPKDYNDNNDARKYDSRLRAPVDEAKELCIDQETGMKVYIASENKGIDTSAGLVRKVFKQSIELGRKYAKDGRSEDLYEALRLMGTGLHCIEDFAAHSNYIELALKELGVDAFPHVGDNTKQNIKGKEIYPLVTGTFGMTDFLHSVVGEVSDKMFQSEVQALDSKLQDCHSNSEANSRLKQILDKVPWSLLGQGGNDFSSEADNLQANSAAKEVETKANISDKSGNPKIEEMKKQAVQTAKDIYPILKYHDQIFKAVHEGIDRIPFANQIVDNLTGALQIYIFSLLSPYITPILAQVKEELKAGSAGVLASSEKGQYLVFSDDNCHDPTHSMLSKDHFTNVLNPVAGQIAQDCVRFAVPRIVDAWEDPNKNVDEVITDILQVFHHPALRERGKVGQEGMFEVVKSWWESKGREQDSLARKLSKEGVKNGDNHEGEDHTGAPGGKGHSHGGCGHGHSHGGQQRQQQQSSGYGQSNRREEESSYGSSGRQQQSSSYGQSNRRNNEDEDNSRSSYGQSTTAGYGGQTGRHDEDNSRSTYGVNRSDRGEDNSRSSGYGQSNTSSYGRRNNDEEETSRSSYGQSNTSSYGRRNNDEEETTRSSGYGQSNTSSYGRSNNDDEDTSRSSYGQTSRRNNEDEDTSRSSYGRSNREETSSYGQSNTSSYGRRNNDEEETTRSSGYGQSNTTSSYGRRNNEDEDNTRSSGYGRSNREEETSSYGQSNTSSYGRSNRDEETSSYGQSRRRNNEEDETPSYGRSNREETSSSYGQSNTSSYGRRNNDEEEDTSSGYGRGGRGGSSGYGRGEEEDGSSGYGRGDESERRGGGGWFS